MTAGFDNDDDDEEDDAMRDESNAADVGGATPGIAAEEEPGDQARGVVRQSRPALGTSDPLSLKQIPVSTERLSAQLA